MQQLNNGRGQINTVTDATVARAELVENQQALNLLLYMMRGKNLNVLMFWIM